MSIINLSALIAAFVNLFLAIVILSRNIKHPVHRTFFLLCLVLFMWNFSFYMSYPLFENVFWNRVLFSCVAFIPSLTFNFILRFINDNRKVNRILQKIVYLMSLLFFSSIFLGISWLKIWRIFLASFLFPTIYYGIWQLYKRYKISTSKVERRRLGYLLTGATLAVTAGITDFLPAFGVNVTPTGSLFNMIYVLITAFAIIRYRLLDLRIMFRKSILFLLLLLSFSGVYIFQSYRLYKYPGLLFLSILLTTVIFLFLSDTIFKRANIFLDRFIYGLKQIYREEFKDFRSVLPFETDNQVLLNKFINIVSKGLSVTKITFQPVKDKINYTILVKEELEERLYFEDIEETERDRIRSVLDRLNKTGSVVSVPLVTRNEIFGVLHLGSKDTGEPFFSDELDALMELSCEAALVLSNIRMFEKMKLMDRLAYLGGMAAGISHEIKNPLGVITLTAQYLRKDIEKKGNSTEYADIILEEANRLNDVVSRFIDFAKALSPRFLEEDINSFIDRILESIKKDPRFNSVVIITNFNRDIPKIHIDPELLRYAFMNLILNAQQAMPNGGNLEILSKKEGDNLRVDLKDSGCGIPDEVKDKIFTPFFTTKEKGSGLGLAICKRILDVHSGEIVVESTEGKGTTFSIYLPLVKKGGI